MIYVREIARICDELHIELHFLYFPFFGAPPEPALAAFYKRLGTLHLLPGEIRDNLDYWADVTHFNPKGARAYTDWLIGSVLKDRAPAAMRP